MADDPTRTVRIRRDSRVAQDSRGRNVWVGRVEPATELELVSTTSLEKILGSGDGEAQVEIRRLAAAGKEGLLARDPATGHYEIVGEEELKSIADGGPVPERPHADAEVVAPPLSEDALRKSEELSLVSTMMLRKVIGADGQADYVSSAGEQQKPTEKSGRDKFGGFDPYNKS